MIVYTMTFDEITNYLLKTTFSKENIDDVIDRYFSPKEKQYRKEFIRRSQRFPRPEHIIFKPIRKKDNYHEELVVVPFKTSKKYNDFIFLSSFYYKSQRYIAFLVNDHKNILYLSYHSIKRYFERYLNNSDFEISLELISKMLIHNIAWNRTTYLFRGETTNMYVTKHGSFLCQEYSNCIVAKTFISPNEYFENQKLLDKSAFEELKKYEKETYGFRLIRA